MSTRAGKITGKKLGVRLLVGVLLIIGSLAAKSQLFALGADDGWVWWPGVTHVPNHPTVVSSNYVIAGKEYSAVPWLHDWDKWHNTIHHSHSDQLLEIWMYDGADFTTPIAKDTDPQYVSELKTCCGGEEYTYYKFAADDLEGFFTWPPGEENFNQKTIQIRFRGIDEGGTPDPLPTAPPGHDPYFIETDDPFRFQYEGEVATWDGTSAIMKPVQIHLDKEPNNVLCRDPKDPECAEAEVSITIGTEESWMAGETVMLELDGNERVYFPGGTGGDYPTHIKVSQDGGPRELRCRPAPAGAVGRFTITPYKDNPSTPEEDWNIQCGPKLEGVVIEVVLLVNNTDTDTDDYVVKQKPGDARPTAANTPVGPSDNRIPMKVQLKGPSDFSCSISLVDTETGGLVSVSPYSGITLSGGGETEVQIQGVSPSYDLDDVKIRARTNKTGVYYCKEEDLTVIWIQSFHMEFRGSDHQDEALTSGSTATFSSTFFYMDDVVGKKIYHKPMYPNMDNAHWQMEIKYQISPNVVIPDVVWDIKREISAAWWGPALWAPPAPTPTPYFQGQSNWDPDDTGDGDEDLIQNAPSPKQIFEIDALGWLNLPYSSGFKATVKAKFQDWVEVNIGGKWYVCSQYKNWRVIAHTKYQNATAGWVEDTSRVNEVVEGTISGWAGSWPE